MGKLAGFIFSFHGAWFHLNSCVCAHLWCACMCVRGGRVGVITARYDGSNLAPTVTLAYLFSNRPWKDKWGSKSGEVKEHGVLKSNGGGFPPDILISLSHSFISFSPTLHVPFLHCASYRCAEWDNPQDYINYTFFNSADVIITNISRLVLRERMQQNDS